MKIIYIRKKINYYIKSIVINLLLFYKYHFKHNELVGNSASLTLAA